jgi:hypothetical protein
LPGERPIKAETLEIGFSEKWGVDASKISPLFEIAFVLVASGSRCQRHRKRGSQHHAIGCDAWRSGLRYSVSVVQEVC